MSNSDEITPDTKLKASVRDWSKLIVPFAVIALTLAGYAISWEKRFADLMTAINGLSQQTRTYQEATIRETSRESSRQERRDNAQDIRIDNLQ